MKAKRRPPATMIFRGGGVVMATPLEATRRIDKIIKEWDRTLEVLNRIILYGIIIIKVELLRVNKV